MFSYYQVSFFMVALNTRVCSRVSLIKVIAFNQSFFSGEVPPKSFTKGISRNTRLAVYMDSHGFLHVDSCTACTAHFFIRHTDAGYVRGTTFARRICIIAHTLAVTIAHSRGNYIPYSRAAFVAQF